MVSVHGCPMMTPGMRAAGGMNVYLRRMGPLLSQMGVEVDIFARSHHPGGEEVVTVAPGVRVIHINAGSPELTKLEVLPYLSEFEEGLNRHVDSGAHGYDLIHSHYWLSFDSGQALSSTLGIPHVASFHTIGEVKEFAYGQLEPEERKMAERKVASEASAIFALSEGERSTLESIFGVGPERIHLVPGGVDHRIFLPRDQADARKRLGIDPQDHIILYVGRPEPFKGPDILIKALSHLSSSAKFRLILLGGAEGESGIAWLRQVAIDYGVADRVRIDTAIPQNELPDYYAAADVAAVPSYHESFGLAALEAMACGVPVVAANVGGLASLVRHNETGLLVDSHSPQDFARGLSILFDDPDLRTNMGHAAVKWASNFSWHRSAQLALAGYSACLSTAVKNS